MSSFSSSRAARIFHHDAADFQHVSVVGDVQGHVGILLDQQHGHALPPG